MLPKFMKKIVAKVLYFLEEYRKSDFLKDVGNSSIKEFHLNSFERLKIRENVAQNMDEKGYDAIISPCYPIPAFRHENFKELGTSCFYAALWNFLDFPTFLIPRVHITEAEDTNSDDYIDEGMRVLKNKDDGKIKIRQIF